MSDVTPARRCTYAEWLSNQYPNRNAKWTGGTTPITAIAYRRWTGQLL
jgi:hypothetical protein